MSTLSAKFRGILSKSVALVSRRKATKESASPNMEPITTIPVISHQNNIVHLQETIIASKIGTELAVR